MRSDTAHAIAALLDLAAVGIEDPVESTARGIAGSFDHQRLIEADAGAPVRERAQRDGIEAGLWRRGWRVEDEEIVAETLHLHKLDPHAAEHSRSVIGPRAGSVIR